VRLLCKLFGHRNIGSGWWGDGLYGDVALCAIDGIGQTHFTVNKTCHRCGKRYIVARFHGEGVLDALTTLHGRGLYTMPSSPGYKRDYTQEYKTAKARGEVAGGPSGDNAKRKRLRRQLEKSGKVHKGDGKDVDHKKPLSKGGANSKSNARVVSASTNRSFPRKSDGSMKRNT